MKTVTYRDDRSGELFDYLLNLYGKGADCHLKDITGIPAPSISKIRNGHANVSADAIIHIHEQTGMSIADIKAMLPAKAES